MHSHLLYITDQWVDSLEPDEYLDLLKKLRFKAYFDPPASYSNTVESSRHAPQIKALDPSSRSSSRSNSISSSTYPLPSVASMSVSVKKRPPHDSTAAALQPIGALDVEALRRRLSGSSNTSTSTSQSAKSLRSHRSAGSRAVNIRRKKLEASRSRAASHSRLRSQPDSGQILWNIKNGRAKQTHVPMGSLSSVVAESAFTFSEQSLETLVSPGSSAQERTYSIALYETKMVRDPVRIPGSLRNAPDWVLKAKLGWQQHLSAALVDGSELCDYDE